MATKGTQKTIPAPTTYHCTGLKPDSPDPRDVIKVYGAHDVPSTDDHPVVDLRKYIHHVYTQGDLACCAANAVCSAYKLELCRQAEEAGHTYYDTDVSRLFVYYNSRLCDNSTHLNNGASFRDTLKAIHEFGICSESLWPYDMEKIADRPSNASYNDAKGNTICKYAILRQDLNQFRACLKAGFAFSFAFRVHKNFISGTRPNGIMPMPSDVEINTTRPLGHGVMAVGYNDNTQCITVLNSWGESFGDNGYFYMPYKYIMNPKLAFHFWKIEEACKKFEIEIQLLP